MASHRRGRHRRPSPLPVKAVRVIVGAGGLGVFGWLWATDVPETPIPEFPTMQSSAAVDPSPLTTSLPTTVSTPLDVAEPEVTTTRPPPPSTTTKKPPPSPPAPERDEGDEEDDEEGDSRGIVDSARSFLGRGIPYVYGGKTLAGMDCSGYIWRVLQKAGYDVPYRTSSALRRWTVPISASEARPGDLAFWPGHAAIYAGDGRIYDSGSTSFGVTERDMWGGASFGRIPT